MPKSMHIDTLRAIKKILGDKTTCQLALENIASDPVERNILFLSYILQSVDIHLEDITDNSIDEELQEWNQNNLMDLVLAIPSLISNDDKKEQFRYTLTHSIKGDLIQSLLYSDSQFANYNKHVLEGLYKAGINIEAWLDKEQFNCITSPGIHKHTDFFLSSKQWERDFRKEYAIGNISECCIAMNDTNNNFSRRPVLIEYFLDLSLQVSPLTLHSEGKERSIGQAYLLALNSLGRNRKKKTRPEEIGSCLGITSVEICQDYREYIPLVVPLAKIIMHESGMRGVYGFERAIMGDRYSIFKRNVRQIEVEYKNLRQRLRDKRKQLKAENHIIYQQMINSIKNDADRIGMILEDLYKHRKYRVEKIGLKKAIENEEKFLGTNYLDIFSPPNAHDGFFPMGPNPRIVDGFMLHGKGILEEMQIEKRKIIEKYFF
jgi:hypothetical protein